MLPLCPLRSARLVYSCHRYCQIPSRELGSKLAYTESQLLCIFPENPDDDFERFPAGSTLYLFKIGRGQVVLSFSNIRVVLAKLRLVDLQSSLVVSAEEWIYSKSEKYNKIKLLLFNCTNCKIIPFTASHACQQFLVVFWFWLTNVCTRSRQYCFVLTFNF